MTPVIREHQEVRSIQQKKTNPASDTLRKTAALAACFFMTAAALTVFEPPISFLLALAVVVITLDQLAEPFETGRVEVDGREIMYLRPKPSIPPKRFYSVNVPYIHTSFDRERERTYRKEPEVVSPPNPEMRHPVGRRAC